MASESCLGPPSTFDKGAGNAGSWPPPWPACKQKAGGSHHRFSQITRHSLRDGFTTYNALSLGTGLSCSHRQRDLHPASLTPASGCQDHTPLPCATTRSSDVLIVPTAFRHPTFVTTRNAPLSGSEQMHLTSDFQNNASGLFFVATLDRHAWPSADGQITSLRNLRSVAPPAARWPEMLRALLHTCYRPALFRRCLVLGLVLAPG